MPANVQALALAHGIELASFVAAYDFAEGVVFITGFADMLLAGAICFSFEVDVILNRSAEAQENFIRQSGYLFSVERSCGSGGHFLIL